MVKTTRAKHKEDINIVKICRLETPKTVDFKRNARRKIKISTPKSEISGDEPSGSTNSKDGAEESDDQVEFLGFYGKIHADESGTGKEETTFEKQYKSNITKKIEQTDTLEITQPEGITRPIHGKPHVVYQTQIFSSTESEEGIYGDGEDRFEEKEIEEFEIKRPVEDQEHRQKRIETFRHHRGCKLRRDRHAVF